MRNDAKLVTYKGTIEIPTFYFWQGLTFIAGALANKINSLKEGLIQENFRISSGDSNKPLYSYITSIDSW